jgi:3-oxoacyl-[acyl-carrier protein] reductase
VVELIERHEVRFLAVETDLTVSGAAAQIFDEAEGNLGPVSILVNNASGWRQDTFSGEPSDRFSRPTEEVTAATIDANFAVDAKAGALLIAEFAGRHRLNGATWGRIVGVSSGGPSGFPGEVSYGAAKAALENYTMSAASELARDGVTANIVYPPITDTGWVTDEVRRFADSEGARVAEPAEVAEVVGWLCTDGASLVTGNRIRLR